MHESGTYANSTGDGVWIGEITEHSIDDAENKLEDRYLGTASRSFGDIQLGPNDITGTLTFNAQNFRLPFWTIGSVVDATSGPVVLHNVTQINNNVMQNPFTSGTGQFLDTPLSFTLEDSKQAPGTGKNFIRTLNGCIPNTTTITATQGEKVVVTTDYIAQSLTASSGTTTSVTGDTVKPYLWNSATLTIAGSTIDTAKDVSLELNQNLEGPHYLNGSRVISNPFTGNRDYTLNVSLDLDSDEAIMLYEEFYKNNGTFNAVLDFDQDTTTGSQHAVFVMSGCYINSMENPSTVEGTTESSVEIKPQNITGSEWTSSTSSVTFNPW